MNVTLVNTALKGQNPYIPMSSLYLGTAVEMGGHKVKIVDSQIEDPKKKLKQQVNNSDCICFSLITPQIKNTIELSDYVKSLDPNIPVLWGGHHPTLFPKQTVSDNSVDYIIRGEGENAIIEFLDFLKGKRKPESVGGLVYKKNKKIYINPEKDFLDINQFSPPSWHLIDVEKYIRDFIFAGTNFGKFFSFHTGRGCPFRCTFCINSVLKSKKWRPLSQENILNEIKIIKEKYNIMYVNLVDENFFLDKNRLKKFCDSLIKEKLDIKWHATVRADHLRYTHLDNEQFRLVRESGGAVLGIGVESGSQKMLDMLKKEITIADVLRAVKRCEKAGIIPACSFMAGIPNESKEDLKKTYLLIKKIRKIHKEAVIIGPQLFRPYPGCKLYNNIKQEVNEPKTLRGWLRVELFDGYLSTKYLPWIEDKDYLMQMLFYLMLAKSSSNGFKGAINGIFKKIADFRVNYNKFDFFLEQEVYEKGKEFYHLFNRPNKK